MKSADQALAWVASFDRHTPLPVGQRNSLIRHLDGNLFTSRGRNLLSVHGHDRFCVTIGRDRDHQAVRAYLREHCCWQQAGGQSVLGIKLVLVVNPHVLASKVALDLDRLLVRTAEAACAQVGKECFGEPDVSFVLGIHHGIKRFCDPWIAKHQRALNRPPKVAARTRSHVHVLLLPKTNQPASRTVIETLVATFNRRIAGELRDRVNTNIDPAPAIISPARQAVLREAARSTCEAIYPGVDQPWGSKATTESRFVVATFAAQLQALQQPEVVRARHKSRRLEALKVAGMRRVQVLANVRQRYAELRECLARTDAIQANLIEQLQRILGRQSETGAVVFYNTPSRRVLLSRAAARISHPPSRGKEVDRLLDEWDQLRMSAEIHATGFRTLIAGLLEPWRIGRSS